MVPSLYDAKPRFQDLLRAASNAVARLGITANQVTLAAAVMSMAVGIAIWYCREESTVLLLLPLALLVRMALNALDGMLAREHAMKSNLGAILNELGDVFSDTVLYMPLAFVPGFRSELVVVIVVLSIISEMAGVVAVQIAASRRYDGPMGKSDRALVLGTLGLAWVAGVPAGRWLLVVLAAIIVLLAVTIVNRSWNALREVR